MVFGKFSGIVSTLFGMAGQLSILLTSGGNFFACEGGNFVVSISMSGVRSVIAGNGTAGSNDGVGTMATFNYPHGIGLSPSNLLFVADRSNRIIRQLTTSGSVVSLWAGKAGVSSFVDGMRSSARFLDPLGLAVDSSNFIFVSDAGCLRVITTSGSFHCFRYFQKWFVVELQNQELSTPLLEAEVQQATLTALAPVQDSLVQCIW